MRLSMAAEFAVRGTAVLATRYGQGPVPLAEICRIRRLEGSKDYMTKIFALLSRSGIVRAIRGKGGGYVLARDPGDVTLLQVIEAIEGPLAINLCQYDPPRCDELDCPVRPVWDEIQQNIRTILGGHTFKELVCSEP